MKKCVTGGHYFGKLKRGHVCNPLILVSPVGIEPTTY
jgi:hypothetical protein